MINICLFWGLLIVTIVTKMADFFLIAVIFHLFSHVDSFDENAESRLLEHIFQNNSIYSRPVLDVASPVKVKLGIELVQLVMVDERSQRITTKLWLRQSWTNELIKWNPRDWGGVDVVNVNAEKVWKPDLLLYNNAEDSFSGGTDKFKTLVTVNQNGTHHWYSPATYISTCQMNVREFPFDTQKCKLKFGSWVFDAKKIVLSSDNSPFITEKYLNSSEWDIISMSSKLNTVHYDCCPHPYLDLTFTFVMRRRSLYYVFNIIAPCIVLVLIVLFCFLLPVKSGERLTLNITVMLSLAIFLQFLSQLLPKTADSTPILSIFYMTLLAESGLALIMTIFILAVHHKGEEKGALPPPQWVRKYLLERIPKELGCRTLSMRRKQIDTVESDIVDRLIENSRWYQVLKKKSGDIRTSADLIKDFEKNPPQFRTHYEDALVYSLQDILKVVHQIHVKIEEQDEGEAIEQEWKMIALMLDRLFFIGFFIMILLSTVIILSDVDTSHKY